MERFDCINTEIYSLDSNDVNVHTHTRSSQSDERTMLFTRDKTIRPIIIVNDVFSRVRLDKLEFFSKKTEKHRGNWIGTVLYILYILYIYSSRKFKRAGETTAKGKKNKTRRKLVHVLDVLVLFIVAKLKLYASVYVQTGHFTLSIFHFCLYISKKSKYLL